MGFFYFKRNPVRYSELDDSQRWQYGINGEILSVSEAKDWTVINYLGEDFKQITPLMLSVLSIIITIIFGTLLAILSAYFPAQKASKINPIKALKF